ncbi:MAG: SAM-dependent methyltransferase [Bacteroidetes bacterium]|nr:MAG: SAM-dependent methyltransferase [Bacteroidota bacterium]
MNFKENESATKLRGGYYTDPEIAAFLLRWVLQIRPERILEPSCGDGVFFRALGMLENGFVRSVKGFEILSDEANKSKEAAALLPSKRVEVYTGDFLEWALRHFSCPPAFDAVVGNPPFIRYQYLEPELQKRSEKLFKLLHLPFTKHTNAWVPFVAASIHMLRPGGRLAMVVPSEILHVLHAQSLRTFLSRECSKILIFDPVEIWFEDTLQGAMLLLAEKKENKETYSRGVGIIATRTRTFLQDDPEWFFRNTDYANGETIKGKWMPALLSRSERDIMNSVSDRPGVHRFGEIADVAVGIVTGANKFFLVPNDTVEKYGLEKWAHPMFGRSEHVPGVIYDEEIHAENERKGLPTNFIWFRDERKNDLPRSVQRYIELGEADELPRRYKCRIREPWYSVPSVYSTSVSMLKRCHDYPRLIFNKIKVFTTDTAYRIKSNSFAPDQLVHSFVNSLTALSAELEGRHYGGGVLELVPSEIRKLLIPSPLADGGAVYDLDRMIRAETDPPAIMEMQDSILLKNAGFSKAEREELLNAWLKLRARRHRE